MGQCAWRLSSNRSGDGGRGCQAHFDGAIASTIIDWGAARVVEYVFRPFSNRGPATSRPRHQRVSTSIMMKLAAISLQLQRQRDVGGGTEELEESAHRL